VENLKWVAEVVAGAVELPLCVDSANPAALDAALPLNRTGQPMVNSITAESERLGGILPLVKKHGARVVALTMDDSGMPEDADGRVAVARALHERLSAEGVPDGDIFFDVLVRPVSTDPSQATHCLEAVRRIRAELPGVHFMCGMSNVSFGLPKRRILNRTFLTLLMAAGQDGVILDPTDADVTAALFATRALLGQDEYCMEYIGADREGRFGE
jgi:5-methyltetrahydrofolate--homocysteine methyltransferase